MIKFNSLCGWMATMQRLTGSTSCALATSGRPPNTNEIPTPVRGGNSSCFLQRAVLFHGRLCNDKIPGTAIQLCLHSYWQCRIERHMSKRQTNHDRHFQRQKSLSQNVLGSLPVFSGGFCFWVHAVSINPHCYYGNLLQQPGIQQMSEHTINSIRRLLEIFDEKNPSLKARLPWRSQHGANYRKVPTDQ